MTAPSNGAPGNSELMRAVEAIRTDIRDMRAEMTKSYVLKAVQDERDRTISIQIQGVEDELHVLNKRIDKAEERQTANFRLALAGLIYPLIVAVIVYLILGAASHS